RLFDRVTGGYTGLAGYFARKTIRLVVAVIVISGGAVLLGLKVPSGFVPEEDQGFFMLSVMLPDASSLQRTDIVCQKVEAVLSKEKDLDSYSG
ncbi:MAG TPA: efflux RND transporter permease subunit, partial [Bacteroidales bacterium]|nr:efflux RND transporter permease subunit [Bacteroidales bacterium]